MRRETPGTWQEMMARKGFSSARRLAESAGVSPSAVTRLIHGDAMPNAATVHAVASALDVPLAVLYQIVGNPAPEAMPYSPPAEASRLTSRQRRAIDEIIRSIVATTGEERDGNVSTAPITRAGESPATEHELTQDQLTWAAYDTGRKSQGRRLRRLQDEAAEAGQE